MRQNTDEPSPMVNTLLTATMREAEQALSPREMQVVQLMGLGFNAKTIADKVHLSIKTVSTYRHRAAEKLGLRNAIELQYHAIRWMREHDQPNRLMATQMQDAGNWRALVAFVMEREGLVRLNGE